MDTPTIAQYYRETDPAKRKELLEQAIARGRRYRGESGPQGDLGCPLQHEI